MSETIEDAKTEPRPIWTKLKDGWKSESRKSGGTIGARLVKPTSSRYSKPTARCLT